MDIKIEDEKSEFKYRASGIVTCEGKILIVDIRNRGYYVFPGGHVEFNETSMESVIREIKEEFNVDTEIVSSFALSENFFERKNNKKVHEISIYYILKPKGNYMIKKEEEHIYEKEDGYINDLKFKWIDLNDIVKYDIRPKNIVEELYKKIKEGKLKDNNIKHFITRSN